MLNDLKESGNDKFEGYSKNHNWTHKSCLWKLSYVKAFILPHNIDLMHQERNVAKSIISMCLDVTGFSKDNINASGHTCTHMCKRRRNASERRTGWSRKLLDIFDRVILLWVYKMVDVKYSRWGGTKVWVWLKWSSAAIERSNGYCDDIGPLVLWLSSISHRKIYDINNKMS
jgi:hypothetical protein